MFSSKPTFASAMGMFSKAQEELKAAKAFNDSELADAEERLRAAVSEAGKIDNAMEIFDNLLGTKK